MVIFAGTDIKGFEVTMKSVMKSPIKIGKKPPCVLFPDIPGFGEMQKKVEETFPQCETEDYWMLNERHAVLQDSNWSSFVGTSSHVTIEVSFAIHDVLRHVACVFVL